MKQLRIILFLSILRGLIIIKSLLRRSKIQVSTSPRLLSSEDIDFIANVSHFEQFKNKRILITGGTGMVGSYLLESLCFGFAKLGIEPKEIRVFSGSLNYNHLKNLEIFKYLKFHPTPLLDISPMTGYDFLIHAASPASPTKYPDVELLTKINSDILKRLISRGMQNAIFISAGEVYGPNLASPISEDSVGVIYPAHPRSAYPTAKIEAERTLLELGDKLGVETNSVRLFHTFGPGVRFDDGRSFADFIWSAARNSLPKLRSEGKDIRTFLFLRDSITGLLTILAKGKNSEKYNLGGSNPISILDFAKRVTELAGLEGDVEFGISDLTYTHSLNHSIYPNVSKIEHLGWKQEVMLDEMILKTLDWVKKNS
jgi:nucleoside-diphosphate-sugar epimerase